MRDLRDRPVASTVQESRKTEVLAIDEKMAGWLCYTPLVGIVCSVIWLATEPKDSKFIRFNALQSIALGLTSFAVFTGLNIIGSMGLWMITGAVSSLFSLVVFVAWITCLYNAAKQRTFKLPFIGDIVEQNV